MAQNVTINVSSGEIVAPDGARANLYESPRRYIVEVLEPVPGWEFWVLADDGSSCQLTWHELIRFLGL